MASTRKSREAKRDKRVAARPTQKDIAIAAGVSQAAVSMVLNKTETPSLPKATRDRILKLASELDYQPNHPARVLRSARPMALACVIPDITNPFYPGLVRGLQSIAASAGYDVLIFDTDGRAGGEERATHWLLQGRADGVVGTFFHLRAPQLAALARKGIPIVRLESQHKPRGPLPIDSVYIDNAEASAGDDATSDRAWPPAHHHDPGGGRTERSSRIRLRFRDARGRTRPGIRHRQPLFRAIRRARHGSDPFAVARSRNGGVLRQ